MDRPIQKDLGIVGTLNRWILIGGFIGTAAFAGAEDGESVEVPTYLRPYRSIELVPVERGVIREILVEPGDNVTEGQGLIQLNSEVIEAQLAEARAEANQAGRITSAEAERDLAKGRYEIMLRLEKRGTSGDAELNRGRATLEGAEGSLKSAEEAQELAQLRVETIEAQLEQRILKSPINGTVVDVARDVAESVSVGSGREDEYLIRVVELDRLEARAHVPFRVAEGMKIGQSMTVRLEDVEKTTAEGEIEFISPIVNPASETVEVRLVFDNSLRRLISGIPAKLLASKVKRKPQS